MRHHYVPQFLLRRWTSASDGKVQEFRIDLRGLPTSRRVPKGTGFEDNLYALTMPRVAGMEQQAVEKHFLRHVDNDGARVLALMQRDGLRALSMQDREDWARFLMSLRMRQPEIVSFLKSEADAHLRKSLAEDQEPYEELAALQDPPTLEEWVDRNYPGVIENFGLSFFAELVDNPNIGTKVMRMRWWLWDLSRSRHQLILADHPCIFTKGVGDPDLVIGLPIGPRSVFMATSTDRVASIMRQQKPTDLALCLNESSVAQARARLYGTDATCLRFIENRLRLRRPALPERSCAEGAITKKPVEP